MPSPMKTAWKTVRKGMTKNSPSRNRSTIASSTLTPTQSTTSLLARRGPLFEKATPDDAHQSQDPTSTVEQGEEKSHPGDSKQVAGKADPKPYLQQEGTKTEPKCSAQDAHPENWQGEPGLSDSHGEAIDELKEAYEKKIDLLEDLKHAFYSKKAPRSGNGEKYDEMKERIEDLERELRESR